MVFIRRTGPLGGAGILALALLPALWYSGEPFAAAVADVFTCQVLSRWLPTPIALALLPTLRAMGDHPVTRPWRFAEAPEEPALRHQGT